MKDIIYVENRYTISVKENSFRFYDYINKSEKFIPISDIEVILLDNQRCYISTKFINRCVKENISLIICDAKHTPIALISNTYSNRNRLRRIQSQILMTQRMKNRMWKKIVTYKIKNQSICLGNTEKKSKSEVLINIAKKISEGDKENKEAVAAKIYFSSLFGDTFARGRFNDPVNAGLNYGYAILRACINQELEVHGLEKSFGIHHKSSENPYNLADDLIEVFRPFVDLMVYEYIYKQGVVSFEINHKKLLVKVLLEKCLIDNKIFYLKDAIRIVVNSLISCFESQIASPLILPSMIEGGR